VRLVASSDFRRIQGDGRRVRSADLVVLYLPAQAAQARVGLTVSRKVGGSVVRNRVKRRLREAVRRQRHQLDERFDVVIIARPSAAQVSAAALAQQVEATFRRIGQGERHATR
jgi:ribonuclease P protein component